MIQHVTVPTFELHTITMCTLHCFSDGALGPEAMNGPPVVWRNITRTLT